MSERRYQMTSKVPATRWQDAFPTGNGTLGAAVYGGITGERILLNHEALFARTDKPTLPDISAHLPELRRLLAAGQYEEAAYFLDERAREAGYEYRQPDAYQLAGDLVVRTQTAAAFREYERRLDFLTGEVTVSWREGDTRYARELFVSRADDTVVLRIRREVPAAVSCALSLTPHEPRGEAPVSFQASAEGEWLTLEGQWEHGEEHGIVARVVTQGGELSTEAETIQVTEAEEVLVLLQLYANEPGAEALPRLRAALAALPADYATLRARHATLHGEMFRRMRLDLQAGEARKLSNEQLLLDGYGGDPDTALIERLFDYGRFLLICSSRPGGLPANLQGVWNGDWAPPWSSDYHNDENIQMNYWQALPGNLPEVTLPYFDYYEWSREDYQTNAQAVYGCRGLFAGIAQTTHGLAHLGPWLNWTAGAGWLAQLFYDYWLFTGDREFLAQRAMPYLKEVAAFYEDFQVEGPDGKLLLSPSLSPENVPDLPGASYVVQNATMDVAIAREVLGNLIATCEALELNDPGEARWREILAQLPEYEINEDGAIREWLYPGLKDNYHHRHQSHIYPLFPGFEVTEESDPRLFEALRVAVEKRLVTGMSSQTGWSLAYMANIYARLGNGGRALECLELLTRSCVGPNLWTYHNDWRAMGLTLDWFGGVQQLFQIDANFGATAAMLEMLVFSQPGVIKLLPALPEKWVRGEAQGIRCRGGAEVSVKWDLAAGTAEATRVAAEAQTLRVKLPPGMAVAEGDFPSPRPGYVEISLAAGVPVRIAARS